MRHASVWALLPAAVLCGCASAPVTRRPEFVSGFPTYDCPADLENQTRVLAEVFPLADLQAREYSIKTTGMRNRRVMLTLEPAGLRRDDTIVWSSITLSPFGGTFTAWTRLQTSEGTIVPAKTPSAVDAEGGTKQDRDSVAVIAVPGQLRIRRVAHGKQNLADAVFIDVEIMPGGTMVDDVEFTSLNLWEADGKPLPASDISFELTPVRHPPALDVVEARVEASFVVRVGRTGDEWACTSETRVAMVDREAIRQHYWDLGFAPTNASRQEWLALFDETRGPIRPIFDSPAVANAFVNWLQITKPAEIAGYRLGAFRQRDHRPTRPYSALDADSMRTFRPITAEDFSALRSGPVGEAL